MTPTNLSVNQGDNYTVPSNMDLRIWALASLEN